MEGLALDINPFSSSSFPGGALPNPDFPLNPLQPFQSPSSQSLVFIDAAVENYEQLISGITDQSAVFVLEDGQDGIAQISQILGHYQNIASVHIISHGEAGRLYLGDTNLNSAALSGYEDALTGWSNALTDTADILLYGCNVANSADGLAFMEQFAQLSGADVAASVDLTGSATLGGDWILESSTGVIESKLAFQPGVLQTYQAVFGNVSTDGLVMHLTFDQTSGTQAVDISPNGNNNVGALLNGATLVDTGTPLEGAVAFDGVNDYVAVENSSDINLGTFDKRAVSAWFKVDNTNGLNQKQVIFEEGASKKGLNIYVDNGRLYVGGWNFKDGWSGTFLSTDAISSGAWHHVGLVLDANQSNNAQSGAFRAYLDGVQFGSGAGAKLTSHGNPTGIGAINDEARFHSGVVRGSGTQSLAGEIADVRLFNRALSEGEMLILASDNIVNSGVSTEALVMELGFDEMSGTLAADTAPNGNNNSGALLNGATFVDTGTALNGAVTLDGVNDYVAVENSSDINLGTFDKRAVSAWFKVNNTSVSNQKQVIFEEGAHKKGLNIYVDNGRLYVGGWNFKNGWSGTFLSTDAISADTWHHVGLVLDANQSNSAQSGAFKAYLDGVQFGSGAGAKLTNHGNPSGIGAINDEARFHNGVVRGSGTQALGGEIADVRLFNRTLSDSEMLTLASGLSNSIDPLPPTASLNASDITVQGNSIYDFTVLYSDNVAVDVSTLDNYDIRVVGAGGFNQLATLVQVVNSASGGPRAATYRIAAPGGIWDAADNGAYSILLEANQVSDIIGNFALDGSLGSFSVNITPTDPSVENIIFPADAGVIDVTTYGAIPDDGLDDTAAIQQALNNFSSGNYVFYFRNGVYDISDTLTLAGSEKRNILQGQSQSGTILRLMDSVDAEFNDALIQTGGANGNTSADRFRNAVRNMTLSVGVGHADAIGLRFWANNQGTVKDVTILSEDGAGAIGLDMNFDDAIGPLLIQDVTVDGFDYGIKTRWSTASQTFEDITLTNQNIYGWWNTTNQHVFARNVRSTNAVTAIRNDGEAGMVLIDSILTGTGPASAAPAIYNQKSMYVRNIQTSGYALAIDNDLNFGRGNPDVLTGYIAEYFANGAGQNRSGGPFELFDSPDWMLGLSIAEIPDVPWETNFSYWDSPHLHIIGDSGVANDGLDDTLSIQAAIDSGATTVYLPQGTWELHGTLELRGNVVRLMGTEAILLASDTGVIRVADGAASTVVIERLEGLKRIDHASDRTLVLNNLLGFEYLPTVNAPGDIFINDSVGKSVTFRNQRAWARQLNIEGNTQDNPDIDAKVLNDNSQVWILGLKSEDTGTTIKTINGGATELLGAFHAGGGVSNASNPRFVTIDSSFSAAGVYGGGFSVLASETRNGETRTTHTFNLADVYTAYAPGDDRLGHWKFNGDAIDSASYGHNGALVGGASFSNNAVDGSQALTLNGRNQYMQTPSFLTPSQQLTLATWVKSDTATWNADNALINKGDAFRLESVAGTHILRFSIRESQINGAWRTVEYDLSTLADFSLTDWRHYAATYDYNTGLLQLYVDGVLRVTSNLSGTGSPVQISSDAGPMIIGHNSHLNTYFSGHIDDVRLFGRALTSAEIFNLANPV